MKKLFFMLLPILAAAWFASLYGCLKWQTGTEQVPPAGRILEFGTQKPIEGAAVYLEKCDGEVLGNVNCFIIDSTHSDANGAYTFDQTGFLVNARKPGYFTSYETATLILSGAEKTTDVLLHPHAWLQINLKNVSGAYEFDYHEDSGLFSEFHLLQNESFVHIELLKGNRSKTLNYGVKNQSGELLWSKVDSVFVPGHDTTSITITY